MTGGKYIKVVVNKGFAAIFVCTKNGVKMIVFSEYLVRSLDFEKRIENACSFNNAKCEFEQGRILNVEKTNISFIEAHRVNIRVKDKKILLLYFDKDNLFLYNRSTQISIEQLYKLLKGLKGY